MSEVTIAVQRIHLGLLEKYQQTQKPEDGNVDIPQFTKIKNLALFAHGEHYGVGLHSSNKFELQLENVKTFVSGLKDAVVDDMRVQLFACSTAADQKRIKSQGKEKASYLEWTEHKQD